MRDNFKLYKHQSEAIQKCLKLNPKNYALFFEQGMGKTLTVTRLIDTIIKNKNMLHYATLIVCPQIVINNWSSELTRFSPYLSNNIIPLSQTSSKKRLEMLKKTENKANRVIIVNYESLLIKSLYEALESIKFKFLIVDESHRAKEHKSQRTKAVINLSKQIPYKYILSGTPVLKSAQDLWSQFLILDGGRTLSYHKRNFLFKYFVPLKVFKGRFLSTEQYLPTNNQKRLQKDISPLCSIYRKEDALDLPPIIHKTYTFELSSKTRSVYNRLKTKFVDLAKHYFDSLQKKTSESDDTNKNKVSIVNIFSQIIRMQQVTSGFIKDNSNNIVNLDNKRLDTLKQILIDLRDQQTQKIILWCTFKHDYAQISKLMDNLNLKYVLCTGEQSPNQKQAAIDSFMDDPDTTIFIGNPKAAGVGLNLTVSDTTIFYNRGYSLEDYLQAIARNHRIGSERHKSITCINIICENSIDKVIMNNLKAKKKLSDKVLVNTLLDECLPSKKLDPDKTEAA